MIGPASQRQERALLLRTDVPVGKAAWRALVSWLEQARERRCSRITLAALDDHALRDVGLTRREAEREAAKPFWC